MKELYKVTVEEYFSGEDGYQFINAKDYYTQAVSEKKACINIKFQLKKHNIYLGLIQSLSCGDRYREIVNIEKVVEEV